ncbi:MAG: flippase-like domain-containing protein [Armatimonadetes bacterium]|jgi:hypothetical protein|nr:flippase-like domain-containing protein [Armatimonadota bacterium]MDI9600973.1 hypothetical protein [Acidobacteriota bacterium]NLN88734.1 hypothetical protein [candidate division WS1 bacterium]
MNLRGQMREWARSAAQELDRPKTPLRRAAFLTARLIVIVLVIYGIGRHLWSMSGDVNWFALRIHWGWLVICGVLYLAAQLLLGVFYRLVVVDMGGQPQPGRAVCAYLVSQLGKYVPGKAMVIIIRAGMLRGRGVRASVAALATFFETPTSLGAGAAIAFGILASEFGAEVEGRAALLAIAGGLALLLGVLMSPWVFRWILKLVSLPFRADDEEAPAVGMRTRLVLIPLMLAVWALLGASAVACADAVSAEPLSATQWPLLLAATALAMAAGFAVVVMPSGLGVREWVIMEVLAPSLGSEVAVFAAVGLRVVWLVVEVLASAITYGWVEAWNRRDRPPESAP